MWPKSLSQSYPLFTITWEASQQTILVRWEFIKPIKVSYVVDASNVFVSLSCTKSLGEVLMPTAENPNAIVPGLFAAGEAACASVHGANRLGEYFIPHLASFHVIIFFSVCMYLPFHRCAYLCVSFIDLLTSSITPFESPVLRLIYIKL